MALQMAKNNFIKNNTKIFVSFFVANILLLIDFNFNIVFRKPNLARTVHFPCEELFQDSTNILLCIIIAPFILLTKWMRWDYKKYLHYCISYFWGIEETMRLSRINLLLLLKQTFQNPLNSSICRRMAYTANNLCLCVHHS